MNNLKKHLDDQLKDIKLSDAAREEILAQTVCQTAEEGSGRNKKRGRLHSTGIAAAVLVFFLTSVTVAAANLSAVQGWIFRISPELASVLYPIEESCEKKGIRLSVAAGVNDDQNADIYFTIEDTERKGRVTGKVDFMDTAGIDGSRVTNVEFLDYDEENQTAYYVLHETKGENFANRRNVFRIGSMMVNKRCFAWFDTGLDLAGLTASEAETAPLSDYRYGGGGGAGQEDIAALRILQPDVMEISLGEDIDFVTVSNIGIVDGKLHVQTKWDRSFDNHGEFWLLADGNTPENCEADTTAYADLVSGISNYYFYTEEDEKGTGDGKFTHHIEFVYDLEEGEDLSNYRLWARLVMDGEIIEGNWKVSFIMGEADPDFFSGGFFQTGTGVKEKSESVR